MTITGEGSKFYDIFLAFNEGVTESLTYYAFGYEIKKVSYFDEVELVRKIGENVYIDDPKKLIKGYLSGSIMHLRDIERFYGKGSLKLLSSIQTKEYLEEVIDNDEDRLKKALEIRKKTISFFMEDDEKKREEIFKEVQKMRVEF